jgi:hypothetical protein
VCATSVDPDVRSYLCVLIPGGIRPVACERLTFDSGHAVDLAGDHAYKAGDGCSGLDSKGGPHEQDPVRSILVPGLPAIRCPQSAIEVPVGKDTIGSISVRDSVFVACSAASVLPAEKSRLISNCIIHAVTAPAFRDAEGKPVLDEEKRRIRSADPGPRVDASGGLHWDRPELLRGKGTPDRKRPSATQPDIGWSTDQIRPGCSSWPNETLPQIRWKGPRLVANSVSEEYDWMRQEGLRLEKQALVETESGPVDRFEIRRAGRTSQLEFDISRFFGEELDITE